MKARIVLLDAAELGRKGRNGEHDTIISGWRNSLDPDELYANLLTCDAAATSTARWCDTDFDKFIDAARATPEQAARSRDYSQAAQRFLDQMPWAALAYPGAAVAANVRLQGVVPGPAAPFMFDRLHW